MSATNNSPFSVQETLIMKKLIIVTGLLALFSTAALASEMLIVGTTPVPHAEILEFVKPVPVREGVDLQVKVFNDSI